MSKRLNFVDKMKRQLDAWTAELHELEMKVEDFEERAGERYRHAIAELHERRVAAETKLEEIRNAGEEVWQDLTEEAEKTRAAFKAGLDALRDFSDHS